jgi:molybdenum cofactor cytidylyltransferase
MFRGMTATLALPRPPGAPRLAAVLLAAGQSRRMGRNKLLEPWQGRPLAARMLSSLHEAGLSPVVVVTGHQADRLIAALKGAAADDVSFVHNPDYAGGLASSVRVGVAALPDGIDGAVIAQADMPRVGPDVIAALIAAFAPAAGREICVPTHRGRRGNPILWSKALLDRMHTLTGDAGARSLLVAHADLVCEVEIASDGILVDFDTPDDLRGPGPPGGNPFEASS